MSTRLSAVDAYIARAQPFAQPILHHLREAVHRAAPGAVEQIKWSRPFFVVEGIFLGNMSAFKGHCAFGLWGPEMATTLEAGGLSAAEGMGSFGRITSLDDLPPLAELEGFIRHAAGLITSGTRTRSIQRVAKPARGEVVVPEALLTALKSNPAAEAAFARMSPSCRREYADWIADAKRDETRSRRLTEAVAMIAEGKSRNWKYETRTQTPRPDATLSTRA